MSNLIVARGTRGILYTKSNLVPILDVCDLIRNRETIALIQEKLPVSYEEIKACMEIYADAYGPSKEDHLTLEISQENNASTVITTDITQWVYISILSYGTIFIQDIIDFSILYSKSLSLIISDCLTDIKQENYGFLESEIHGLVFEAFQKLVGEITKDNVDQFIALLDLHNAEQPIH